MLGTSESTAGGVSAVIRAYRHAGLFERYPVVHLVTHCDGSAWKKFRCAVDSFFRYLWLLMRGKIALVHVHGASNASFWRKLPFILLAFATRRKVIFHLHGGGFLQFYEKSGEFARRCIRTVLNGAATVIAVSDYWLAPLQAIAPRSHIVRIYNPLSDVSLLNLTHAPGAAPRLLFLGRIATDKGVSELLGAFADIHADHPNLMLAFGGDGELASARTEAAKLGIEPFVEFHGWVGAAQRTLLLQSSSAFVLPSYMEGLPMALLEAMAAGLPTIATQVGGVPDLVSEGVEGLLVAPKDRTALAGAIASMFRDDQRRAAMSRAARERIVRDFYPDKIIAQVEALYDALLQTR